MMNARFRPQILTSLLVLVGCGTTAAPTTAPEPAAEAIEDIEPVPVVDAAHGLAQEVVRAAGDLARVNGLAFRFVVTQGGERAFEAMHHWDVQAGRDLVEWTGRDGKARRAVVDIVSHRACGTIDGAAAAGADLDGLSEQAYGRFINDSYWLVMPLKLGDPGVTLTAEDPRERDGKRYSILRMSFDHVGLTPGDVYWLFIDPESKRIERWEMKLEGQEEPPQGASWTDYREVAGLTLAHDHATDDGSRHVRFEDTGAFDPSDGFPIDGCPGAH